MSKYGYLGYNKGHPALYGYFDCHVIENYETSYPLVADFTDREVRPIHRYCRKERFRNILYQLLGWRGRIPEAVLSVCRYDHTLNPAYVWKDIRRLLKTNGFIRMYNRIPRILVLLGVIKCVSIPPLDFEKIMDRFSQCEEMFRVRSECEKRIYFPSLRFVCIKILEEFGYEHDIYIEEIITKSKRDLLNKFWVEVF